MASDSRIFRAGLGDNSTTWGLLSLAVPELGLAQGTIDTAEGAYAASGAVAQNPNLPSIDVPQGANYESLWGFSSSSLSSSDEDVKNMATLAVLLDQAQVEAQRGNFDAASSDMDKASSLAVHLDAVVPDSKLPYGLQGFTFMDAVQDNYNYIDDLRARGAQVLEKQAAASDAATTAARRAADAPQNFGLPNQGAAPGWLGYFGYALGRGVGQDQTQASDTGTAAANLGDGLGKGLGDLAGLLAWILAHPVEAAVIAGVTVYGISRL